MTNVSVVPSSSTTFPDVGRVAFGTFVDDIATYFGLDQDPQKRAFIKRIIGDVIDDLNRKKLWQFNLVTAAAITTSPGVQTYSLSVVAPDLWRIYNSRKTDSIDYTITGVRESTLDTIFQSQLGITGYPYLRADFNIYRDGTIKLFPIPDGAYSITLRYFKLITKPSADTDTLDVPPPYQSVIKYGALARLAAMAGQDTVTYWESKFGQAYEEMNQMDENQDDEIPRFINAEEQYGRWSYQSPNARPSLFDFY